MFSLHQAALLRVGGPVQGRAVGSEGLSTPQRTLEQIVQDLKTAQAQGARAVVLVGGEPLLRRDLSQLFQMIGRLGMAPGLATCGRLLVYPERRRRLLDASVEYVRLELHAARAEVHDALVEAPGTWEHVLQGLRGLVQEGSEALRVDVACTVTARNVALLEELVQLLASVPRRAQLGLRLVASLGGGAPEDWALAKQVSESVGAALALARTALSPGLSCWEGFAPCLLGAQADLRDELLRYGLPALGPPEAGTALPRETQESRRRPYPCQECLLAATCPGAPCALVEREGEQALRPSCGVRANSFNFERVKGLGPLVPKAGQCEARRLDLLGDPVRHLILLQPEEAVLYKTTTGDFSVSEIRQTKDELQQVYLDRHPQATLREFLHSVQRVRLHAECLRCPDRSLCCGAVAADPEPAFEREERWITKEISRLRGRVLDVGCGDLLYREEIRRLSAEGQIDYHGVDPDPAALAELANAGVGGTLHCTEIERFDFEPGYFDYVLALRSFNHFRSLTEAFSVIARVLRPQGQFVLCDSVVYALLRTPDQAAQADASAPVGQEHYRNWSSQQVVEFAKRFPFRVDVHRPVGPQSCNQWIVKLMRVSEPPLFEESA